MDKPVCSFTQQRYQCVIENIAKFYNEVKADKENFQIVDLGCGGAKFFSSVKCFHDVKEDNVATMYFGVDVDACHLHLEATTSLRPKARHELTDGRFSSLHAVLLEGDLWTPDDRLRGTDVVTMLDVVEHLDAEQVYERLPLVLFGDWRPGLLVLSTPNREHQLSEDAAEPVITRPSKSGNNRFEWDQVQFAHWCLSAASAFHYSVELLPVGPEGAPKSIVAVFKRYDLEEPLIECPTGMFYRSIYQVEYAVGQDHSMAGQTLSKLGELTLHNVGSSEDNQENEDPEEALSPARSTVYTCTAMIKNFMDTCAAIERLTQVYTSNPHSTSFHHRPDIELRQVAERVLLGQLSNRWRDFDQNDLSAYTVKLAARGDTGLADECEANIEVLARRQRDLDLVKSGTDYARYLCLVPKQTRQPGEPRTPNKFRQRSRRNWEAHLKTWRQEVHEWNRSFPDTKLTPAADMISHEKYHHHQPPIIESLMDRSPPLKAKPLMQSTQHHSNKSHHQMRQPPKKQQLGRTVSAPITDKVTTYATVTAVPPTAVKAGDN